MHVLLLGGSGLMGPHAVRELTELGHDVVCLNRRGVHPSGGRAVALDRNDEAVLGATIRQERPDVLVDMIPFTEKQATALAGVLRETRTPLVACSSSDVYRAFNIMHHVEPPPYQPCPLREDDALRSGLSPQGRDYDKLHVEQRFLELPGDVTILRLPAIYGWPDTYRVASYVNAIRDRGEVRLHPAMAQWRFCRSFTRNCAHAVTLSVASAIGSGHRIYNVAEPTASTEEEWVRRIGAALDWDGPVVLDETCAIEFGMDVTQHLDTDTSKIRAELGYAEIVEPGVAVRATVQACLDGRG